MGGENLLIRIGNVSVSTGLHLFLIAGPCVIEGKTATLAIAQRLKDMFAGALQVGVPLVFKASYDKANRTRLDSYRGPGLEKGLEVLDFVKDRTGLPVISDVHAVEEIERAAQVLDAIQIPAFLCRQTDLLIEAGKTGLPINVKKGQFLPPEGMWHVVEKIESTGNRKILLTERGTCFGYGDLVVDFRSIQVMREFGYPVVFDASHAVSGARRYIPPLARAAVASGAHGIFLEVHPEPDKAKCDGGGSVALDDLPSLMGQLLAVRMGIDIGCKTS